MYMNSEMRKKDKMKCGEGSSIAEIQKYWQEEVPDQSDYIEEMYKEPIAYYLSVEGDVW